MRIGIMTDSLAGYSLQDVIRICVEKGIEQLELGCGNWSSAPHINIEELLRDKSKRDDMVQAIRKNQLSISALNCSGNQLAPGEWGKKSHDIVLKTFELTECLEVENIVMMSGLPGACPEDRYPNWVVTSWPSETQTILDYQWNKVAIPYWQNAVSIAKKHGVKKIALEPHGSHLVYNVENFYKLKKAVGSEIIGFNMDPSHLFWMGADPIRMVRELGKDIYHVHIKDIRVEDPAAYNTMLDTKPVLAFAERSWNFSIPGYGHDEYWWKTFITNLSVQGYDGVLSIEHEDYTMDFMLGIDKTVDVLKRIII